MATPFDTETPDLESEIPMDIIEVERETPSEPLGHISTVWTRSHETVPRLITSLAQAQLTLKNPLKDRTANVVSSKGSYKYDYADLANVLDAVREPLAKVGLVLLSFPATVPSGQTTPDGDPIITVAVETVLAHASGEWISATLRASWSDGRPQTLGGLITYLRRYGASCVVGIASEQDDDASAANGLAHEATTTPRAPSKPMGDRVITPAQEKFLLAEMGKHKVGTGKVLAWHNNRAKTPIERLSELPMGVMDEALAFVRSVKHEEE
jgi:hypothetical protein